MAGEENLSLFHSDPPVASSPFLDKSLHPHNHFGNLNEFGWGLTLISSPTILFSSLTKPHMPYSSPCILIEPCSKSQNRLNTIYLYKNPSLKPSSCPLNTAKIWVHFVTWNFLSLSLERTKIFVRFSPLLNYYTFLLM